MCYYPPAKKCKLDSPGLCPISSCRSLDGRSGVQLQPDSQIILVHCQDLMRISVVD